MCGSMTRCLGIDVGGGGARWTLAQPGEPLLSGVAPAFSGHLFRPEIRLAAKASLTAIAAAVGSAEAVVAGVTGLTNPSPEAEALSAMIAAAFGASRVAVMSDSRLAYLGVFAPGEGILIYAGTGSVASHVAADGALTLLGGKGVILDDAGGGYWIAVRALRGVLRREDEAPGSAWDTPLGRTLAARIGGCDWLSVRQAIYGGGRGDIGRLAAAVGEGAAAGDEAAKGVLVAAGRELAALALAMERRIGARRIALCGGAVRIHPALPASFRAALDGREISIADIDAALAAARLAASPSFFEELRGGAAD